MTAKYYAVRHTPSGKFLPLLRKKKGHTFTTPLSLKESPPRLHLKESSAKKALYWWLKGVGHESYGQGYFDEYPEYDGNDYVPQPDRKKEEMEVVEVRVTVKVP